VFLVKVIIKSSTVLLCIETPVYTALSVTIGQSVELSCNTSLRPNIVWTCETGGDPYVQNVYWNGRIAADKPRLSVKTTGGDFHSLIVSDVRLNDSGIYNCYDGEGLRKVGYQLDVTGR